ncbi:MAG: hypothetical protein KC912_26710, partial [Proteobacteria bacterium]|nr:hypothetical protein [Pseudomonadota bacterium]
MTKGLAVLAGLIGLAQPAMATECVPAQGEVVLVPGNPNCEDIGFDHGFKLEGGGSYDGHYIWQSGAQNGHNASITIGPANADDWVDIRNHDASAHTFDWAASQPLDAVIVKGGPEANTYIYYLDTYEDCGLGTPEAGISHIEFCHDGIRDPCAQVDCSGLDDACGSYACDPEGEVGNCDVLNAEAEGTECRAGSGDLCDPAEVCDGIHAACPDDAVASAGTVCDAGSGDICDTDEVCSGVAGEACPVDAVAAQGTVCNAGSGDACDPDEVCSGIADEACPVDIVASAGVVCNEGSGDACDPDEVCSGVADEACPDDSYASAQVVCNAGSG